MSEEALVAELREQVGQLRGMMKSPGWALLEALAKEQLTGRIDVIILNPVGSADGVFTQEFMKGEVSGIKLFCKMPEILIERYVAEIEEREGGADGR